MLVAAYTHPLGCQGSGGPGQPDGAHRSQRMTQTQVRVVQRVQGFSS